jgi:hypothetical protein
MNIKLSSTTSTFNRGLGTVILEGSHLFLRAQHLERTSEVLLDAHHGSTVVEFSTIVGGGEDSDQLLLCEKLVPVLDNLMCAAN